MEKKERNKMDALTFIKEKERMCKTCGSCILCPAWLDDGCIVSRRSGFAPEQQINTVKVWAESHPLKTRQSVFLEQYPDARLDPENILCICPENVYGEKACIKNCKISCYDCRHQFWMQEVE